MAQKLREIFDIKGITVYDITTLLAQFADDTTLFLSYDTISLNAVIDTFKIIEENTGLKINCDKTALYRIGSIANSNAQLYTQKNFTWKTVKLKF